MEERSGLMPLCPRVPDAWPSPSATLQALSGLSHLTALLPTGAGEEKEDTVRLMGRMLRVFTY